jgi:hypothetical protein
MNMYVRPLTGSFPNCEKYIQYGKKWMLKRGIDPR